MSEVRVLLQILRVYKFWRVLVFLCLINLDHSSLLYLHSCLDTRNVVFISANKPTTHVPQFSTALVIQLDAHVLLGWYKQWTQGPGI